MNPSCQLRLPVSLLLALSALAVGLRAQSAAEAADPAQAARDLAKYDKNHNGQLDPDELAAMQADAAKAAKTPVAADGEALRLSPFEVNENTNGYYAANTMSGNRLNTKIEDLGSAISVVTKAQMADFAMLDINDIFNYEANTEGTGNFTDYTIDRNGMAVDNIQNNPQGANRIRGVGPANIALDNFATSGRVPIDPSGIDGVEISRGPNSNIFGLGQGSGTVNMISASAALNRETSTVEVRMDSVGGYRTSLDVNRPLLKNRLAVRFSTVYQHDAYNEKPSGTTTHRYNFMLRAQPFKSTTVRASFQSYDLYGSRASAITPRDAVTYWKTIGSPTWDPTTSTVTVNGVSTVTGSVNPTGLGGQNFTDPILFVDGGIQLWEIGRKPGATATNGPDDVTGINRMLETIAPPVRTGHPLYNTVPGISNKAIFDWSKINLAGINSIKDHDETTTVQIEQSFLNTERQVLAVQGGWNHEHSARFNKNIVGQSTATGNSGYVYVDVNSKLLDGRPNPYFLRPYLGSGETLFYDNPYNRDTFRGQAAYKLDFTTEKSWMKWLGRHSLVGYAEENLTKSYLNRFRDVNINDNPIYAPAGMPKANQKIGGVAPNPIYPTAPLATRGYYHFYVGDNNSQNVDYAPTGYKFGQYTFNWFNPLANGGAGAWVADPGTLAEAGTTDVGGGISGSEILIKTHGAILQDAVFDDRVIFTGGERHDENDTKVPKPYALNPDGYTLNYAAMNGYLAPWQVATGDTTTKGVVVKPFRGWQSIDHAAASSGAAGFFAGLLRGFDLHYNRSDSFAPVALTYGLDLHPLANPSSNGEDYGFSLNLWNDKLVLRANRYTTNQLNNSNLSFATYVQRVLRVDFQNFGGNADAISLQRQARDWVAQLNPTYTTQQIETSVYQIMGLTHDQDVAFGTLATGDTQDVTAKGDELELNYNPDRFWTLKFSVTKTQSIDSNISPRIPAWIAQRMPIWTTIIDPRVGTPWWTTGYTNDAPVAGAGTPQTFLQGNVLAPIALAQATQGKSRPEIREWHYSASTSLRLAKYTEQKYLKNMSVGGSLRWESKGAIGYYGIPVNNDITQATAFDPNRPVYVKANTYVDAFVTYNTRLFHDKIRARFQLNARNIQEWKARLEPVGSYPDGSASTFRVIEPMSLIFTTTFDL